MQLIWRKPILKYTEGEDCSVYNFYDTPFMHGSRAVWFYDFRIEDEAVGNVFAASDFDLKTGESERFSIKLKKGTPMPAACCWKITERDGGFLIDPFAYHEPSSSQFCLFFDGKNIEKIERNAENERKIYSDSKTFTFGNLQVKIANNSTRKLECIDSETGERLWTFTFVAYLYTDIYEYDGVIYFGTAGAGGRFYGLNLLSGKVLHEVNTHGTSEFARYKEKFYFPSANGELTEYDPRSKALNSLSFGKGSYLSDDVEILVEDGKLYSVVAERAVKNSDAYNFSLVCVEP